MRCFLQKVRGILLDALFPAYCLGCRSEGVFLCIECRKRIPGIERQMCPWCYVPQEFGRGCGPCTDEGHAVSGERYLDGLLAGTRFEEHSLIQRAIHQLKYEFVEDLADPLGQMLFETFLPMLRKKFRERFLVCPLPLHPKREQWRGFNQSELMCASLLRLAHQHGYLNVTVNRVLERVHFSKPQMELTREERVANVLEAFNVSPAIFQDGRLPRDFEDATVVLVDDIATTLSTMNSAAGALRRAGFTKVHGLVLARVF